MESLRPTRWHRYVTGPLALQSLVVLCVLFAALTPSTGGTALYVPLEGGGATRMFEWLRAHDAGLVSAGPMQGTFIIFMPKGAFNPAPIRDGALLIAVPEALCGVSSSYAARPKVISS